MTSITFQPGKEIFSDAHTGNGSFSRFFSWIIDQERNRIAWVGISLVLMTALFFPLTMASILFNGAPFGLIIGAMVPLVLVVVTNLAALPTKFTIPSLLIGISFDLALIMLSILY